MIHLFKKDLKLFFTDRRSVLLTFLLPVILITLFAFAFGGIGGSSKPAPVKLLVADLDQSNSSESIAAKLDSLEGLVVIPQSLEKAERSIKTGKYPAVLIFHPGFEAAVHSGEELPLELMYDRSREAEIGMLQPVLMGTVMGAIGKERVASNISRFLNKNYGFLGEETKDKIIQDVQGGENDPTSSMMQSEIKMTSIVGNPKEANLGLIQATAGTAILMLLFSVAGLGTSILEEKENGTLSRLRYSPISSSTILYGKMLFTYFIAILQLVVMFLFARLAFGLDIMADVPALVLMILATGFAVSSFGIFLAAVSKSRQQAQSLSTLIILVMSAIGGSMIPLFVMPAIMRKIAVFSVNYWGIQGFYDIFWRGLPLSAILPKIFVLLGIGVVMTFISLRLFKRNLLRLE